VLARARRFAMWAFAAMAVTGSMLFAAEASHLAVNPVFLVKLALIGAGLANIAIYEFGAKHAVEGLAPGTAMPSSAKFAAHSRSSSGSPSPPAGAASPMRGKGQYSARDYAAKLRREDSDRASPN